LKNQRKVSTEDGQKLADELGIPFVECSAKDKDLKSELNTVFVKLLKEIEGDSKENSGSCLIC
jgi:hypothetical protein